MDPATAIREWKTGEANYSKSIKLLRRLLSHSPWYVPLDDAAAADVITGKDSVRVSGEVDAQGQRSYSLFSDLEAYRRFANDRKLASENYAKLSARSAFECALGNVDRLWINPCSPHNVGFVAEQFVDLQHVISAMAIEDALARVHGDEAGNAHLLSMIKKFPTYYVALRSVNGRRHCCLVTDAEGHRFIAAFTMFDCCDAYASRLVESAGVEIQMANVSGGQLFESIIRMGIDGAVFNIEGPPADLQFPLTFARRVLDA